MSLGEINCLGPLILADQPSMDRRTTDLTLAGADWEDEQANVDRT